MSFFFAIETNKMAKKMVKTYTPRATLTDMPHPNPFVVTFLQDDE